MIAPDTTVAALLAAYPGLENELVAAAPAMARLKNPVLRAAFAESATVAKIAEMAGLDACDLVKRLRSMAGLGDEAVAGAPAWVDESRIRFDIDAGAMLEQGVHPIGRVRESAAQLGPGELLRLISPFRPDPLLEAMRRSGMEVWCGEVSPGRFATFMTPAS